MSIAKFSTFFYNKALYHSIIFSNKIQFENILKIESLQEEKFNKLIEFAVKNVPYYKAKLENIKNIVDLTKMDFLTKDLIRNNFFDLKSINVDNKNFLEKSTSGSTGESLYFYTDMNSHYRKATSIRGDSWAGLRYGRKALHFWGAERDIDNNKSPFKKFKDRYIIKEKMISTYHMSDNDLANFVNAYNIYEPNVIISYPSPIYHLAKFIETNNIEVKVPKGIITSAETLFPFQREIIEKSFKSKVFNRYGSREFGHIAAECEMHMGMHINIDRFILEIVDVQGELCKPGELGEIVITDLDNLIFPFIRYKTGDLGILSNKKCTCGRNLPLLEKVEGRIFDLVKGTNGNIVAGTFWTLLKHKIKGWHKFQVIQEELNKIDIIVENNYEIETDFKIKLIGLVKEKLGEDMLINIKIIDNIPLTKTGKHRWINSKVSPYAQ